MGVAVLMLVLAYLQKRPCLVQGWGGVERLEYQALCYNDLQPLYNLRGFQERQFPYIEQKVIEYPPLIGLQMWVTSLVVDNNADFFRANAVANAFWALLALAGLLLAFGPELQLLWFAAAPPLLIYAFINWDMSTVALTALAMAAWQRGRWVLTGAFLGVGLSGKMYPLFVLAALGVDLLRRRGEYGGLRPFAQLCAGAVIGWSGVNMPLVIAEKLITGNVDGWLGVFAFHARRIPDFGSMWHWLARIFGANPTGDELRHFVDVFFLVTMAVVGGGLLLWQYRRGQRPWRTAAALMALCLVVAKVHSAQYALWFLPFLVAEPLPVALTIFFLSADLLLFVSGFWWYGSPSQNTLGVWGTVFGASTFIRGAAYMLMAYWWGFRPPVKLSEPMPVP